MSIKGLIVELKRLEDLYNNCKIGIERKVLLKSIEEVQEKIKEAKRAYIRRRKEN